ncbi:protein POLR1D [Candoia aspera]|uniref:protein POLR1D n=1 Tax=Candoia aspera TaxID=51853 RepID=UPI002FD83EAB
MADDAELERKAVEELLIEAKRGKTRAETMGPMGWMKCPLASTNKRFLINTIKNTLHSPKEQDQGQKHQEETKESEPSQSREDAKPKRPRVHPYKPSFRSRRVSCSPPRHRHKHKHRNQNTKDKYEKRSNK